MIYPRKSRKSNKPCFISRDPNDLFAYGDVDGKGIDAKLQHPLGVAFISATKSLIVADSYNHKLKVIQDLDQRVASCITLQGILTNEPGGIGLSQEASILYVADTNNHTIKAIDLKTNTTKEIIPVLKDLDCTDEGAQEPIQQSLEITLPNDKGIFTLALQLKCLPGTHLNPDAPSNWAFQLPPDWENDGGIKGPLKGNHLDFNISYAFNQDGLGGDNKACIKLVAKTYLCSDVDGTCSSSQNSYEIICHQKLNSNSNDKESKLFQFPIHLT